MKIKPFKMRVNPEQSKRVQEVCIEDGAEWRRGACVLHTGNNFIYLTDSYFTYGDDLNFFVNNTNHAELTYTEFMELYAWEPQEKLDFMQIMGAV